MDVIARVRQTMQAYGIPEWIWRPIMQLESQGNPAAHNTAGEDSRGLFQINVAANPQFAALDLFDPIVNARIAAVHFLAPAYQQVSTLGDPGAQAEYVWREGLRPEWTEQKANAIRALAGEFSTTSNSGGSSPGAWLYDNLPDWVKGWMRSQYTPPPGSVQSPPSGGLSKYNPYGPTNPSDPRLQPVTPEMIDKSAPAKVIPGIVSGFLSEKAGESAGTLLVVGLFLVLGLIAFYALGKVFR